MWERELSKPFVFAENPEYLYRRWVQWDRDATAQAKGLELDEWRDWNKSIVSEEIQKRNLVGVKTALNAQRGEERTNDLHHDKRAATSTDDFNDKSWSARDVLKSLYFSCARPDLRGEYWLDSKKH